METNRAMYNDLDGILYTEKMDRFLTEEELASEEE